MASENGHLEVVKLRLDRGGDPNAKLNVSIFIFNFQYYCIPNAYVVYWLLVYA